LIVQAREWAERLAGEDGETLAPLLEEAQRIEDHRGFA
jgi:hypothetical protein